MRTGILGILVLLAAGCIAQPMGSDVSQPMSAGKSIRYECYTNYARSNHVLTLPVPNVDADLHLVEIVLHGDSISTIYERDGLAQLWMFEENLYIQLDPDLTARYWDFRGAEEGEERMSRSEFVCEKRG